MADQASDDRPRGVVPVEETVTELDVDAHRPEDLEAATREALRAVGGGDEGDAGGIAGADGVVALQEEIADLRDRAARTLADFENFRKRSEREREEARRYAVVEPLRDVVAVVDNLERALAAGGSVEDLKRGVEMILKQISDVLRRHHVREVEAEGQPFDPALHEAVARVEDPAVSRPTVSGVLQRGYVLHDRLLRPSMVRVAVPPTAE